ncbi:MAG: 4'-phosphopantetheinyl transferase superfamily protein [Bacteroidota bacterium]
MPFIREINPSDGIRAGIWLITETAGELHSLVQLNEPEQILYQSFKNDLRKRHWLAYRALLRQLISPFPSDISYNENGKPFLNSGSHYISVSHAGEYAAAVCCKTNPVGIDIEQIKERVERVKERFLLKKEVDSISITNRLEHLYVHWCGKEALYKLNGTPELDFRNDIHIHPFDYLCNSNHTCKATLTVDEFPQEYKLYYEKIENNMLVIAY